MTKLYLGISGKMGSGKTTLTNNIISALEHLAVKRVSLAQPIKDIQDSIYRKLNIKMEGEKDRPLLIALGMWGRDKDPDFWLKQAVKQMGMLKSDIVICDDVRFPNEAKWFEENGMLIRIEGEQRGDNVDESRKTDRTETALDDHTFKYTVSNLDGIEATTMSALYAIAQHQGVTEELMDKAAEQIRRENGGYTGEEG